MPLTETSPAVVAYAKISKTTASLALMILQNKERAREDRETRDVEVAAWLDSLSARTRAIEEENDPQRQRQLLSNFEAECTLFDERPAVQKEVFLDTAYPA